MSVIATIVPIAERAISLFGSGKRKEAAMLQAELLEAHLEGLSRWAQKLQEHLGEDDEVAKMLLEVILMGLQESVAVADQIGDVLRGKDDART